MLLSFLTLRMIRAGYFINILCRCEAAEWSINMYKIYLSPSTQEFNLYTNGGTEEFYMNLIADEMEPYLKASNIDYVRNTPEMTARTSIEESNNSDVDLHVSLHSNASPEAKAGQRQGSEAYYNPNNRWSKAFADIVVDNLKLIYPDPDNVRALPTDSLGEVTKVVAPGVLIEFAYHDNESDATWIKENINPIAKNVVMSITEYFGVPFVNPSEVKRGIVNLRFGNLNMRKFPSLGASIVGTIPNGAEVTILKKAGNWYYIKYGNKVGYVHSDFIQTFAR